MMSPDDRALEDLLYSSDLGDEAEGAELGGGPPGLQESAAADNVSMTVVEEVLRSEGKVLRPHCENTQLILTPLYTVG